EGGRELRQDCLRLGRRSNKLTGSTAGEGAGAQGQADEGADTAWVGIERFEYLAVHFLAQREASLALVNREGYGALGLERAFDRRSGWLELKQCRLAIDNHLGFDRDGESLRPLRFPAVFDQHGLKPVDLAWRGFRQRNFREVRAALENGGDRGARTVAGQRFGLLGGRWMIRAGRAGPHLDFHLANSVQRVQASHLHGQLDLIVALVGQSQFTAAKPAVENLLDEIAGDGEVELRSLVAGHRHADDGAARVCDRTARIAVVHAAVDLHLAQLAGGVATERRHRGFADRDGLAEFGAERETENVDFLRLK